ncbi:MAG: hypothetical protein GX216_08825 [Methanomicrobiales archaeon]|nr:hypothetical protein [Methanomicrobiales archaeon]
MTAAPTIHRDVTSSGEAVTITYTIDGVQPVALGIVETVPEGWRFAETDSAISTAPHFEVDRAAQKIAFFISNQEKVSYTLMGSGDGVEGFVTEWVDLCELSPDKKEGKERWNTLGKESAGRSASSADPKQRASAQRTPGFGISIALFGCMLGACAIALRDGTGGDGA